MKSILRSLAGTLALLGMLTAPVAADTGETEYRMRCAVCHGQGGKGNGPYVELLKVAPPDLTLLAKRNGGTFPIQRVYEVIQGGADVKAHGPRDMPVWGFEYRKEAAGYYMDYFKDYDAEAFVRKRVLALVEFLLSLQE